MPPLWDIQAHSSQHKCGTTLTIKQTNRIYLYLSIATNGRGYNSCIIWNLHGTFGNKGIPQVRGIPPPELYGWHNFNYRPHPIYPKIFQRICPKRALCTVGKDFLVSEVWTPLFIHTGKLVNFFFVFSSLPNINHERIFHFFLTQKNSLHYQTCPYC